MAQFKNIDSILKTPQFRKNSTNGLPESMADELVDNNIHMDKHNNIKLLYLIYVLSASFIGIIAILVLFLSIFQIFQNKNIRKKIIFLYLILFFKIFFLGALGSTGDYLRYGDETRLIIILISALLVKSYSLTRKVKLQKK